MNYTLAMGEMCVAFQVEPTTEILNVYWKYLARNTIHQVTGAITTAIATESRFPPVSMLRDLASRTEPESAQERYRKMGLPV